MLLKEERKNGKKEKRKPIHLGGMAKKPKGNGINVGIEGGHVFMP